MALKLYVAAAGITLCALCSCGGNNNSDYIDKSLVTPGPGKKDTVPTAVTQNAASIPIPGMNTVNPDVSGTPVNIMPQNNNVQMVPGATTATAPGMNPPHGQPGHRCDISVGAPLNSKPAAPANVQPATVSSEPNPVTITQVPNTQKTAPGMNPPHGEPGHRCDIAVGAPLDSKPAATTPTPPPASAPPLILAPVKTDSTKN